MKNNIIKYMMNIDLMDKIIYKMPIIFSYKDVKTKLRYDILYSEK